MSRFANPNPGVPPERVVVAAGEPHVVDDDVGPEGAKVEGGDGNHDGGEDGRGHRDRDQERAAGGAGELAPGALRRTGGGARTARRARRAAWWRTPVPAPRRRRSAGRPRRASPPARRSATIRTSLAPKICCQYTSGLSRTTAAAARRRSGVSHQPRGEHRGQRPAPRSVTNRGSKSPTARPSR